MTAAATAAPASTRVPWTPVLVHIVLTVALTFAFAAPFLAGAVDPELIGTVVPFAMSLPALVSLLTNRLWRQGPIKGLWAVSRRGIAGPIVLAVAVMLVVPVVQLLVATGLGLTQWAPRENLLGAIIATPAIFAVQLLFATGEELGWRGYLQTLLAPLGFWPLALLLSAVWVAFHAPAALALWAAGESFHATLLYLGDIFFIGFVFAALRLRGGSVWPVVVAHALLNSGRVLLMQNFTTPELQLSVAQQWGLHAIGWVLFAAATLALAGREHERSC